MSRVTICTTALVALAVLLVSALAQAAPPQYTITRVVLPDGSPGEILFDPDNATYQKNNVITVAAVPADGWNFDRWEGALSGNQNPTTLRVGGNATVTAVFVESGGGGGDGGGGDGGGGTSPGSELPETGLIVGYFAQWTIYQRGYLPKHIHTSGSAAALNVINYAFAAPDANLRCASLDTFADWGKRFDASESVDGVADTVSQPLKGNFNQLLKLKQMYPNLRVLLSLGGWTQSYRFSDAALPENRQAFVASCIDMFMRGNVAPGISAAGVFDGLDIDWEYPGSCGDTCNFREADEENFPALLAEFRTQLGALETDVETQTGVRPEYLLTIAAPAGASHYGPIDIGAIHEHLDWINIMAYDFHGGWESSGPANHHAPVFRSPCDPETGDWGNKAVQVYLGAGVPGDKLLLGAPFYGRGWRGVAAVNDGLCQPARGVPRGTYEKGVDDYKVLAAKGWPSFRDPATATHWIFNGNEFWSYDDETSIAWKAHYVNGERLQDNGGWAPEAGAPKLRGMMFWELSGDAADATLLNAMRGALGEAAP
jgi:chitinase